MRNRAKPRAGRTRTPRQSTNWGRRAGWCRARCSHPRVSAL